MYRYLQGSSSTSNLRSFTTRGVRLVDDFSSARMRLVLE
jgi:hypothetical protein